MPSRSVEVIETPTVARLPGGDLAYTLRRSPRASRLRVTIHPERDVVVTVPPASRRGWAHPEPLITRFLADREPWVRRHLARQDATRARLDDRLPLDEGRRVPYRGVPHRVSVAQAPAGTRRSRVSRVGGDDGDELLVERTVRDQRPTAAILEAWLRERARADLERAIERHGPLLGVTPARVTIRDTTTRWGSCSRKGALSFSWRLVLAPPEALDAVAAHELCHLRVVHEMVHLLERKHNERFIELMSKFLPQWRQYREELNRAPLAHAEWEY